MTTALIVLGIIVGLLITGFVMFVTFTPKPSKLTFLENPDHYGEHPPVPPRRPDE